MKNHFRLICLALLLTLASLLARAEEQVTLNFVNSDIESTIKAVGVITGKNFVIDPKVKGTINIVSNQPVSRDLIYQILLSALRQQGFTAIDNGQHRQDHAGKRCQDPVRAGAQAAWQGRGRSDRDPSLGIAT
jgi:type II secretory pathway component GspD/PulD (secretin)